MTDTIKISRDTLEDLRDLAFDEAERHRQAMGVYRRDRQARIGARFEVAAHVPAAFASGMGIAVRLPRGWGGRFQQAWPPRPGQWQRPAPPGRGSPPLRWWRWRRARRRPLPAARRRSLWRFLADR